ncbi:MAG: pentapeptide repeat-containing protein [Reinekea sp.]|nr:pentapeptide repeat-containing protein [Reinekea sp.]
MLTTVTLPKEDSTMAQCGYLLKNNEQCPHPAAGNGLCFWHDPTQEKTDPKYSQELEALARSGHSLEGFALKGANLEGINLVKRGEHKGYDLRYVDLYRADLHGAHLFMADLRGASLMKANLCDANLHYTNLKDVNLLGTKLTGAKIENVIWGEKLLQEQRAEDALKENNLSLAYDYLEQTEEICRNIRNVAAHQGLVDMAGHFFHKEMTAKRKQHPKWSVKRAISKFVDLTCGYGERPMNVIYFSWTVILFTSIAFYFFGVLEQGQLIRWNSVSDNGIVKDMLTCLYYSVVSFTTLGYGDIIPVGYSRFFAAAEAFTGSFTLALFVVVFVKKMTR